ncbi:hypothetical protein A3J17_00065 [Candidatus Curtissbacteria bacterium RIFCSPLOWO2_02_FULL_40_11]|uniref:Transposase IS200-like domain-containing protein n=2 Tax=Candidatus Curtissiibacteriota TaxID=1752717 RepID=A0A1F5G6I0_9BACT|nr:MAG: hypothetical protein A3D04_04085 [Candidatus Curtissbacteria bacterium RIFCSPHIGHO2_02_FULL_40_16b]OGD99538.1 MAG: hypothetical protein A3J17_00065 [Candidatus Curtissbacteria bacterium RIFCSPLOWO2_02_FULL_40_11]OGE12648.1 MAG: hypothetical protein A3G14_00245 [Candidatus Curtissbacteria bacterium RIFCSPLOWO2_12_FULL_38_9]
MPAKNSLKIYLENGYYHIYNRGAGKSKIFKDNQDYNVFLHYLEKYLDPKSATSLRDKIKLLAYCLMPNHFHLFVFQKDKKGIVQFMRSLCTSYAMYFNKRYERSGTLFQGRYKAALVESEPYFLHLSRYIHLNPVGLVSDWQDYRYSSYKNFLGKNVDSWLDSELILNFFKQSKYLNGNLSYKKFVEDYIGDSRAELEDITID